jgi:3-isopropylmalate/(R)-2-methylmalate dehydratase small subunit
MDDAESGNPVLTVDLERQRIKRPNGEEIRFEVDAFRRECLLNGWDDIGLTLRDAPRIDAYETRQRASQPWLYSKSA